MKHAVRITLLLVMCVMTLCSCGSTRKTSMVQTTHPDGSVSVMPYESPAYKEAGAACFAR